MVHLLRPPVSRAASCLRRVPAAAPLATITGPFHGPKYKSRTTSPERQRAGPGAWSIEEPTRSRSGLVVATGACSETTFAGGFGLSSSGGGASRRVEVDVANFCCPEYLDQMVLAIQRGWDRNQGVTGASVITFTIRRDGLVDSVLVRRSSGFYALDNAAMRAVARAERLPALPGEFPNASLTVHVTFEYQQ